MAYINPKCSPESREQITLFEWAALNLGKYPELELLYHIPNGGKRAKTTAIRLKLEGVKSGVPDLKLPVPRGIYNGLYIELKAGKNKPTKNQEEWLDNLKKQGYFTAVCYGWESASEVLLKYLSLPRVNFSALLKNCVSAEEYKKCFIDEEE